MKSQHIFDFGCTRTLFRPGKNDVFKVNIKNGRTRFETQPELIIKKTPGQLRRRQTGAFITNSKHHT